jgi:hypothetical protein
VNGHAIADGLITALDCDFRIAARKPARFGLNEVPIGIPMPAAYVEIIKYALGDQIAALATLRGKLYELDEAARLGFFHEVVEPDKLLATAVSYARCITPDCNTAYAMSKKALQDGVLRQAVTTDSFGSPDMYPFLDENRHVQFWPVEETNHEPTIAMQAKLRAVNATMPVDLLGQCASETLGRHYISGSGGQPTSCAAPRGPTERSRSS